MILPTAFTKVRQHLKDDPNEMPVFSERITLLCPANFGQMPAVIAALASAFAAYLNKAWTQIFAVIWSHNLRPNVDYRQASNETKTRVIANIRQQQVGAR